MLKSTFKTILLGNLGELGGAAIRVFAFQLFKLGLVAIIYVLDSSNRLRLEESYNELSKLLSEKELKEASLLVFSNKQDLSGCMTIEEITDSMNLYKLCCGRSWHIQACDAQSGTGLYDGLDWLARQLVSAGVTGIT
ncbi:E3 ubiquitin-protein ligase TRIM23 [Nymphon striatum]|nr:E3 ubiquitin-protein ligase TRIM23 [Nymphon striatum]